MKRAYIKSAYIITFSLLLFGSIGLYTIEFEKHTYYERLDTALKEKCSKGYLDQKIIFAIKHDQFSDAVMYQHLAEYLNIPLKRHTLAEIEEHSGFLSASWRNTKKFGLGFLTGESDSMAGITGSIAADMTLYGDLRDLSVEGSNFVQNKPYDRVVFGMSIIGVGLSVTQLISAGSTTPLKVSVSIVKVAKKIGYLSSSFIGLISSKLSKAIDFHALKKVDFSSINSIRVYMKDIAKTLNTPFIRKAFKNINTIKKNTSIADTIALMKYVDDAKDLQRISNISKKYKANTKAVLKVLGKGTVKALVKGSAKIIKWSKLLVSQLISLLLGLLSLLISVRGVVLGIVEHISSHTMKIITHIIIGFKTILKLIYGTIKKI